MCDDHTPFYRRKERTAALVHNCDECRRPIMPGERYMTTSGVWEGEASTYRAHVLCDMLAEKVCREGFCRLLGELLDVAGNLSLTPFQARWMESLTGLRAGED